METLFSKARAGESINEAIPALRQCATAVFPFPTADEREHRRKRAFEALRYVDSDFVAEHLAKYLGDHARADFNDVDYAFAQQTLSKLDAIFVNIDDDLIRALAPTSHSSIRQQPSRKNLEGQLLYVLAKLGTDRERVGKLVLSRLRWPLGTTYYTDDHYRSVRLCAEQCGSLFPSLQQAYLADIDRTQAQTMIAALAVYHDDAWAFFDDYLQDRFVSDYSKRGMATAFADTWLRTSKTTQQETSARILASAAGITPWLHGRSASQISRLNYNEGSKQDVLKGMREGLGGEIPMPKAERPTRIRGSVR